MTDVAMTQGQEVAVPRPVGAGQRLRKSVDRWLIPVFVALALFYLMLPILVMIAFSFNDPPGRFNFVWGEFSLDAWANPFGRPGLQAALVTSLVVATLSTIVATILGTLIALALSRYNFTRALEHQPLHLHPDGDAGDRPWREPPDPLCRHGQRTVQDPDGWGPLPARRPDHPPGPHHVQHQLRRGHRASPHAGVPTSPRGSGDGPRCHAVGHLLEGDVPAHPARDHGRAPCWPSRCRSTTSSSRTSRRGRPRPSRSGSGPASRTTCRPRSTSSGR